MAAKPNNVRFMPTSTGKVHVVSTKTDDVKNSACTVVKKGHTEGRWGRKKGLSPEAAVGMDPCAKCDTHGVAKLMLKKLETPAERKANAKAKAQETMDKLKGSTNGHKPKGKKEPKRRGPKQSKPETMEAKAREHAELAKQHGWAASVEQTGSNEWTCEATKGKETLRLVYADGRTTWSRVTLANGVEVRLRNSSNWRKYATGQSKIKGDYQPRARGGKKAAKREVIEDDAPRKLPFTMDDEDDAIIDSLKGRQITWRVTMTKMLDAARVPIKSRNVRVSAHPKSGRRMISFHELHAAETQERVELLGPERTVYLDKILKVK